MILGQKIGFQVAGTRVLLDPQWVEPNCGIKVHVRYHSAVYRKQSVTAIEPYPMCKSLRTIGNQLLT